jgi:hypothetical protein
LLGSAEGVSVDVARGWPAPAQWQAADAVVVYQHGEWNARRAADLDAFLARGGGATFVHWSVDGGRDAPAFARRIGLAGAGAVSFRHGDLALSFRADPPHPITRNMGDLRLVDESYWNMVGDLPARRVLATATEAGAPRPQLWTLEHGRGRVFVSIPGHYSWTFDDPLFRLLLLRGILWTAKEPVDRWNDLIRPGANQP